MAPLSFASVHGQGQMLLRRFLALPPVRRLGILAVGLVVAVLVFLHFYLDDARFHNRVFTYIEPNAESLGIIKPATWPQPVGSTLIPHNLWQIALPPAPAYRKKQKPKPKNMAKWMDGWRKHNPHHKYSLLRDDEMSIFVLEHIKDDTALQNVMMAASNPALKSDLLRYLLLYLEGGVYTDLDTISLKPIDKWIPEKYRGEARVVIGIEFDRLDGKNWRGVHSDLQFCQWTIAAAPGHRVFEAMLTRAMAFISELHGGNLIRGGHRILSVNDILTTTGPAAWTDAVFQELRSIDPTITSLRDLSGLKEERLIGDILILPIDGFGMGQRHSNSTRGKKPPPNACARHQFHGNWRIA
ncbi:Initiation-specific alpha-1,6-mannosyltransferase [Paramyrothecium foliicola]|nr:Initiation-specific alpha-1,6-mannosyltransferase [Paramyrothecium foliicola]